MTDWANVQFSFIFKLRNINELSANIHRRPFNIVHILTTLHKHIPYFKK